MRKRYVIVGMGQRARCFMEPMLRTHRDDCEVVGLCDSNEAALRVHVARLAEQGDAIPWYLADDFERMMGEQRPDTVLVLTPDHTHDHYICRSMELGCDVITEKPLTTNAEKCQRIIDAQRKTGRSCKVTFNYRYAPWNTSIKEILMSGAIGRVVSMNRRHTLGHAHGPFYFHRWHGEKSRSGGLLVHKSTHYFDLLNFFAGSVPERVFARCEQNFFTLENAKRLGLKERGARCEGCASSDICPYYVDYRQQGEALAAVEARGASEGYYRDLCVFRPEADAPDTMHVMVEYESGAILNYSLVAFGAGSSDETIFGTHGILTTTGPCLRVTPYYGEPYDVVPPKLPGGHGGGDPVMCEQLFADNPPPDPCKRDATQHDGAWSILIGVAADQSATTGKPVLIRHLVNGLEAPDFAEMAPEPQGFETRQMRAWVDALNAKKMARKGMQKETMADTFDPNARV